MEIFLSISAFIIAAAGFLYGTSRLFKKGKPLYFQILICAVGCYAIEELFSIITIVCGGYEEPITVGMLGIFGLDLFLFSANYGQLDKIVDDGKDKRAKSLALVAPIIIFFAQIFFFLFGKNESAFTRITLILINLPSIPASYYNLKHLLLKNDDLGFLKATRWCNIMALAYYAFSHVFIFIYEVGNPLAISLASVMNVIPILGLSIAATKGADLWAT